VPSNVSLVVVVVGVVVLVVVVIVFVVRCFQMMRLQCPSLVQSSVACSVKC